MPMVFASGATMDDAGLITDAPPVAAVPPSPPSETPAPPSVPETTEPPAAEPSEPTAAPDADAPPSDAPPEPPGDATEEAGEDEEESEPQTRRQRRAYEARLMRENERGRLELQREKARNDFLMSQLQHLQQAQQPAPEPSPPFSTGTPSPRPTRPRYDQFATTEEFQAADDVWMEQRMREAAQQAVETDRQQQRQAAFQQRWQAQEIKGREKYDDYDLAIQRLSFASHVAPLVSEAYVESDVGPDVFYYLSTHPAELHQFNQLSPWHAARTLAELEHRLAAPPPKREAAPPPVPPPVVPAAPPASERPPPAAPPPPVTPVGGGGTPPGTMPEQWGSLKDFERWTVRQQTPRG